MPGPSDTQPIKAYRLQMHPTPLQAEIIQHPASRRVVCAGRRAGKTTLAAMLAVERLLVQEQKILITSTTQDQADTFWDTVKEWLAPLITAGRVVKNEQRRLLQHLPPDGRGRVRGRLRVKTGSNPDVLRGDDADLIIFDECAMLDPAVWYEVAAPMLSDRDGQAVFISTPRRKNFFFHLYQLGVNPDEPRWQSWHASSYANPHLSTVAIRELAGEMTDAAYQQEILAQFLESDGQVFRYVAEAVQSDAPEPYAGRFVAGLDWGMQEDYTAVVVMDAERRQMVALDRFHRQDWYVQRGRIEALVKRWQVELIVAEANAMGAPNIEALRREGLPVVPFQMTATSKPMVIESLVLSFERRDIRILDDPVLQGELEAFERTVHPLTGHTRYSAPEPLHDDCVIALALAWWATRQEPARLEVRKNPFY